MRSKDVQEYIIYGEAFWLPTWAGYFNSRGCVAKVAQDDQVAIVFGVGLVMKKPTGRYPIKERTDQVPFYASPYRDAM